MRFSRSTLSQTTLLGWLPFLLRSQTVILSPALFNLFFSSDSSIYSRLDIFTYLEFCFTYSIEQIITRPTRATDQTVTLIDHILTNSPDKVRLLGIMNLGLSDHDLIYCTRKTSLPKSHKHNEVFVPSMKRYCAEKFLEILREIVFPNYLTYTCVNDAYSDVIYRFVEAINFIA